MAVSSHGKKQKLCSRVERPHFFGGFVYKIELSRGASLFFWLLEVVLATLELEMVITTPKSVPVLGGAFVLQNTIRNASPRCQLVYDIRKGAAWYCKLQHQNRYQYWGVLLYCKIQYEMLLPDAVFFSINHEMGHRNMSTCIVLR